MLTTKNDSRLILAKDWINGLNISKFLDLSTLEPASEDASFRRYFRINDSRPNKSLILMDSPPQKESVEKFIKTSKIFCKAQLRVPKIFEENRMDGFLILEDFGNKTYLDLYKSDNGEVQYLLENAWDSIIKLQIWGIQNPDTCKKLPIFSEQLLSSELQLFTDWYLEEHLKIQLSLNEQNDLQNIFNILSSQISKQFKVIVHRDFHSRNLMVLGNDQQTGILDFQDSLLGPPSYDLASLLRDAYFNWSLNDELIWAKAFWQRSKKYNIPIPENFEDFLMDFDWNSIQRHLKILGIFCRLAYRDKKPKYLKDLPRVRQRCIVTVSKYKEFDGLFNLFKKVEKAYKDRFSYF